MTKETSASVQHINSEIAVNDLENARWNSAAGIPVEKYWSGKQAPKGRHFTAKLLWSDTALYVRCDAVQTEPLVVSEKPILDSKTKNLWDRDVCEIFLAPDPIEPRKYFEFEIAPTGEWIDLAIDLTYGKRKTDWKYGSGMEAAARIEKGRVLMAIKIPWSAFGRRPKSGDVWLGNIFRCVGTEPDRGYLAWQPTITKTPNFHVPERFGNFKFIN